MLLDVMSFIHENFLLTNKSAQRLYHEYAEGEPILDYHCHLPPREVAENRRFQNLFEIWLEGDHYKWRAMRANGIGEEYCTRLSLTQGEIPGVGNALCHRLCAIRCTIGRTSN